jgi:hypothetical protein
MQSCLKCVELNKKIKIELPKDLNFVIRLAKQKQAEKILSVIEDSTDKWAGKQSAFDEIAENYWTDIILFEFKCNYCEQRFKLGCETYHGAGGDWKPIKKELS